MQKANAVTQSAAQEAALSAEQSAREELKSILDQQKLGAQREKEVLLMQVRAIILYVCDVLFELTSTGILCTHTCTWHIHVHTGIPETYKNLVAISQGYY